MIETLQLRRARMHLAGNCACSKRIPGAANDASLRCSVECVLAVEAAARQLRAVLVPLLDSELQRQSAGESVGHE